MRILALDTATEACSVALLTDTGIIGRYREVGREHAELILAMIDAVLVEAGVTLSMLDGIAASVGPGAFTGVRISVSVAQGLAFGAQLPVIPVTTLEALAFKSTQCGASEVLVCMDARMGEVYWGCYGPHAELGLVTHGVPTVGAPGLVVVPFTGLFHGIGRGFAAYPSLSQLDGVMLPPKACDALPDAREMAVLGALRLRRGAGLDPADLQPQYLRDKVAQTESERALSRER